MGVFSCFVNRSNDPQVCAVVRCPPIVKILAPPLNTDEFIEENLRTLGCISDSNDGNQAAGSSGSATSVGLESDARAAMDILVPPLPSTFGLPLQQELANFVASESIIIPSKRRLTHQHESGIVGVMNIPVPPSSSSLRLELQQQLANFVASQSIVPGPSGSGTSVGHESGARCVMNIPVPPIPSQTAMPPRLNYGGRSSSSRNEAGPLNRSVGDESGGVAGDASQFIMPSRLTYGLNYGGEPSSSSKNNEAGPNRIRNEQEVIEISDDDDDEPNYRGNKVAGPSSSARVGGDVTGLVPAVPSELPRVDRPEQQQSTRAPAIGSTEEDVEIIESLSEMI